MNVEAAKKRVLILCTTTGYQTRSFAQAAERLGLEVVFGSDRCHVLEDPWRDGALALRFEEPEECAQRILEYARAQPIDAIVPLGDRPTPAAARACAALGLPAHPPEAADICRDKYRSRERLRAAGLNVPEYVRFSLADDPQKLLDAGAVTVGFPCVLKPLALSASRGVIRANHAAEFARAFARIRNLLRSPEVQVLREDTSEFLHAESYVEGDEIAVEALVVRGRLEVLAVFDKPEPLTGPFFEETIYVTPSRLPQSAAQQVEETLQQAVRALGLRHGPLHAELRLNQRGVWPLEVAARPIGGLCARALRFRAPQKKELMPLEELVIRLALGEDPGDARREEAASGVMMLPVPGEGYYQETLGVDDALAVPGITEVRITAKPQQRLVPLPEGSSYPGFLFARGASPEAVEEALRAAHGKLCFVLTPALPVIPADRR